MNDPEGVTGNQSSIDIDNNIHSSANTRFECGKHVISFSSTKLLSSCYKANYNERLELQTYRLPES